MVGKINASGKDLNRIKANLQDSPPLFPNNHCVLYDSVLKDGSRYGSCQKRLISQQKSGIKGYKTQRDKGKMMQNQGEKKRRLLWHDGGEGQLLASRAIFYCVYLLCAHVIEHVGQSGDSLQDLVLSIHQVDLGDRTQAQQQVLIHWAISVAYHFLLQLSSLASIPRPPSNMTIALVSASSQGTLLLQIPVFLVHWLGVSSNVLFPLRKLP